MILPEAADFLCRETGTVRRSADAAPKAEAAPASPGGRHDPGDAPDYPHNGPTSTGWLSRHRGIVGATALIALVLAAYWPLLHAGFFWDAALWVQKNPYLHHWSGLGSIWRGVSGTGDEYYPLTYTAFWLQHHLWGASAPGYHLVNLALQAANSILLWRILKRVGLKSAWLVAAIFAIHPVQVETVGWILEQKNLLSGLFYFCAVLAWLRFAGLAPATRIGLQHGTPRDGGTSNERPLCGLTTLKRGAPGTSENPELGSGEGRNSDAGPSRAPTGADGVGDRSDPWGARIKNLSAWGWYLLATLLYALALLAKTDACTLPAILLLLGWWKHGNVKRRDILALLPWFIAGALMAGVTIFVEHQHEGAKGLLFQFSPVQHLLIAGKDLWFYPLKLLWPWPLLIMYPRWHVDTAADWQWLYPATAFALPVAAWALRRRIGRGPFTALAFYGITISPVLGFIPFSTMAFTFAVDHLQYLACIGVIILGVETARRLLLRSWRLDSWLPLGRGASRTTLPPPRPKVIEGVVKPRFDIQYRGVTVACGGLALAVLGILTWNQSQYYSPQIRMWYHVLRYNHDCPVALEQVGVYECQHGRVRQGMALLMRALHLSHGGNQLLDSNSLLDANIGDVYRLYYHNDAAAATYYRLALQHRPIRSFVVVRLAQCYERLGDWSRAIADLEHGLREFPQSVSLHLALANALAIRGDYHAAAFQYRLIVQAEPHNAKALYNLAVTLQKLGKTPAALATYQQALRWAPRWARAYFMYGQCLLAHGQPLAAAGQFRQAIAFAPAYPPIYRAAAYQALARALAAAGHAHQAAAALARAAAAQRRVRHAALSPPRHFSSGAPNKAEPP